jgi:hypothetical protein
MEKPGRTDKLVLPSARDFDHSIGREVSQTVLQG